MPEYFTSVPLGILGGVLIGLSASIVWLVYGKIAGISGMVGGILDGARSSELSWRVLFILGLIVGGIPTILVHPEYAAMDYSTSLISMITGGFLVGLGTRLGNGCSSGHGVCGLARMSVRSFVAVVCFMGTGVAVSSILANYF